MAKDQGQSSDKGQGAGKKEVQDPGAGQPKATETSNAVELQLGCHVTLFKTELHAIYERHAGNDTLLIYEPNAGEEATGIKLSEVKAEIENMINLLTGSKQEITLTLPDQIQTFADNLEIYIRQVFLKAEHIKGKKWNLKDYALWISIETTDELKETFNLPLTIEKVFLKLWKTDNEYIKSTMNISQVEKLIPSSSD